VTLRAILSNHFGKMAILEQLKAADYSDRPCDALTKRIIGAAIEVHRTLGPGLLESAYEAGLKIERQKPVPLVYKNVKLDCGYRLDLVVEEKVIVEVKT
jgi:hypothetical protein